MKTKRIVMYQIESEYAEMPALTRKFLNAKPFPGVQALLKAADRGPVNIRDIGWKNWEKLQVDFPEWNFDEEGRYAPPFIKTLFKGKYIYDRRTQQLSRA